LLLAFYCADTASVQLTAYVQLIYPNLTLVFSFSGIAIPHWYPRCKNKMRTHRQLMFGKRRQLRCVWLPLLMSLWSRW